MTALDEREHIYSAEAQADRLRTLTAEGYVVKVGRVGVTVFKAGYGQ
jgi:hypothetical protein